MYDLHKSRHRPSRPNPTRGITHWPKKHKVVQMRQPSRHDIISSARIVTLWACSGVTLTRQISARSFWTSGTQNLTRYVPPDFPLLATFVSRQKQPFLGRVCVHVIGMGGCCFGFFTCYVSCNSSLKNTCCIWHFVWSTESIHEVEQKCTYCISV